MKPLLAVLALIVSLSIMSAADSTDTRCYELRIYYAAPGKLDDLHARFRNHTMRLFEKHGMENIGYWVPLENSENKLIYLLGYPSREARAKAWKAFGADPDWRAAARASEVNGRLVSKVDSFLMQATDYSPIVKPARAQEERAFELRIYKTPPDKLDDLDARFRNHTVKLFSKHGMSHVAYWHLMPDQKEAANTLVYILAHKSKEAGAASFAAFRADPDWIKAKGESEKDGSLTLPNGVTSVYMKPTDYSPTK